MQSCNHESAVIAKYAAIIANAKETSVLLNLVIHSLYEFGIPKNFFIYSLQTQYALLLLSRIVSQIWNDYTTDLWKNPLRRYDRVLSVF